MLIALAGLLSAQTDDAHWKTISEHTLQGLAGLPDCTCLETLDRQHRQAGKGAAMRPLDIVRLEILYSHGHELYASPGEQRWDQNPSAFAATGLTGNGPFALYLGAVFDSGDAVFTSRGDEPLNGHPAVRYDFRISRLVSGHRIKVPGGEGTVGMRGSLWADPVSLDLLRLEVSADEIPDELPLTLFTTAMTYGRRQIGDREVLLPQTAEMHMVQTNGEEDRNTIEFTHCRSFHSDSTVSFDGGGIQAPTVEFSATAVGHSKANKSLPGGLSVTIALSRPVNEQASVGSAIEGRVTDDVKWRGAVVIPRDALAHGRLRRMDRYSDRSGDYFVVALEFIEIETRDSLIRFVADLTAVSRLPGLDLQWSTSHREMSMPRSGTTVVTTEKSFLPEVPGVGAFFLRATKFTLPVGMELTWKTRSLEGAGSPH